MSAKTSKARTEAFFAALAETGNQTISAERARVSRSWVTLHRSTDPAFKARMEEAIAQARERLSGVEAVKDASKRWATIDGEELVVRGSRGRRAQISRARLKQWTARGEDRFLSVLSATCNVTLACRAVGLSVPSAYMHRERWPEFGHAWDRAVEDGYEALELGLLENGIRSLAPNWALREGPAEPALPMTPMNPEQALRLLGMRRAHVTGRGKLPGNPRRATEEETNAAIVRRLRALQLRDKRKGMGGPEQSPAARC